MAQSPFSPAYPSLSKDEATSEAWQQYRTELHGLSGKAYDNAEERAWDELQQALAAIERRAPLTTIG